ncbi:MAG: hypothetical protein LH467_06715 [Gemmatimonadaceae bacterium]|nr:hypothetical protein [Gemmatimonadaceae bacterium]
MRIRILLGTWAVVMSSACGSSTAPPAFAGDYHLTAVNGAALPASLGGETQVMRGSLHLGADERWFLTRTQVALTLPGSSTDTLSGHWVTTGNDIILYFASTSVVNAVATYAAPAVVVVYAGYRYTVLPN